MNISIKAEDVKALREITGAGMMKCKNALTKANGNMDNALEILRAEGLASADKKADREVKDGVIECYIHSNKKLGVLVEVNCETDFVSRRDDFQQFAKDLAMQIAAMPATKYLTKEDALKELEESEIGDDICLFEQQYIKDPDIKMEEFVKQKISQFGENIKIARFEKFILGE